VERRVYALSAADAFIERVLEGYSTTRDVRRELSWAYWIPLALAGLRTAPGSSTTHEPWLLGPALAAFIITGLTEGRASVVAFAKRLVLVSRPTLRFLIYSLSP
jgi:hypothetical protein